jgi:hypothetical protein
MNTEGNSKLESINSLTAVIPSNKEKILKLTSIKIKSSMRNICTNILTLNNFERFIEKTRVYKRYKETKETVEIIIPCNRMLEINIIKGFEVNIAN